MIPYGTHTIHILRFDTDGVSGVISGEVVGIDVSEEYLGEDGLLHLSEAGLIAFSSRTGKRNVPVGSYVRLGETIGRYGFTADTDIRTH